MADKPYIKPSDARSWLHCKRRVWYDNFPPEGFELGDTDPFDALIMQMGMNHEWGIKRDLEKQFEIIEAVSNEHTLGLMKAGAEVIYQGELIDEALGIIGKPDFLIKQPNGEYQAADAKLSRNEDKKEIQIQLGVYRKLLGNMLPAIVFIGDKSSVEIGIEADKETEKFLTDMPHILASTEPPEARYGESKCKVCPYNGLCKPVFEAKEELTLLYGIDARSAPGLEAQGIPSISALSKVDPEYIDDVPYLKGFENKRRAVLQAQAYFTDKDYQIAPVNLPKGTWVHFDIEVNPLTDRGEEHVYLWGFLKPPYKGGDFEYVWTDHEDDDKQGWLQFLDLIEKYKSDYLDLVLCHFSPYEVGKIKLYPTIGYGHVVLADDNYGNITGAKLLDIYRKSGLKAAQNSCRMTKIEAEELLLQDAHKFERAVLRLIDVPLTDGQFDALVSFTYNLGPAALQRSTLRQKVNREDHVDVPHEFRKWVFARGRKLKGLIKRRNDEAEVYAHG